MPFLEKVYCFSTEGLDRGAESEKRVSERIEEGKKKPRRGKIKSHLHLEKILKNTVYVVYINRYIIFLEDYMLGTSLKVISRLGLTVQLS